MIRKATDSSITSHEDKQDKSTAKNNDIHMISSF